MPKFTTLYILSIFSLPHLNKAILFLFMKDIDWVKMFAQHISEKDLSFLFRTYKELLRLNKTNPDLKIGLTLEHYQRSYATSQ